MQKTSLARLSAYALFSKLADAVARDRGITAEILAILGEIDSRALYLAEGYASTLAYCVGVLQLSEDSALKRIRAARVVHSFPVLLDALIDGVAL